TAIIVLTIATSMAAATDDGGCSMDSTQEVQFTNDPLKSRIDDILVEDRSVFLFFYSDWCPYCHQQMPIIDELEEKYVGEVAFIKINVTARPDHAAEFNVTALPTMIVISGTYEDEYLKEEISGFTEKAELVEMIAPGEGYEPDAENDAHVSVTALAAKCNSCSDCTKKLNGDYDTVVLTTDLTNIQGSCIIFGADDVVFDGDGYKIEGDDKGEFESGIEMIGKSGNTIRNCVITDFESGITLYGSSKNEIHNNEIVSNYYDGIWISENSDSNNIHGNQIEENGEYGVFFSSNSNENTFSENVACSNPTDIHDEAKNSGDENFCDTAHNWNDDGVRGCTRDCASRKPDLVITDISNDDGRICYTMQNRGDATAYAGHYTTLFVDGLYQIKEQVDVDLAPGASVERCFDYYTWNCTPPEDVVEVCADYGDFVDESNEENNCIEAALECAPPGPDCVDFEDLPIGAMFYVKDVFTDSGAKITVQPFQWGNGQWTTGGFAEVGNAGDAGGSGNEMQVNNVNLGFDFGSPCGGLTLLFGEYGGNLNIEINGDFRNFRNVIDINGTVIGGVSVSVVNGLGNDRGRLELSGTINSFAIGGQELWIDHVCPISAGGCVIPTDDLYINSDTTLCPGFYDIPDVGADGVIIINADGVVLDCNGATINGTGSGYGICNYGFDNVTVKNGNVMNYRIGIQMRTYADYNTIINNNLSLNTIAGIELFAAGHNMIANNAASSNDGWGIYLELHADNNTVVNNTANSNKVDGIRMEDSSCGNMVRYNLVNSNAANGIHIESSSNCNELIRNVASSNEQNGIHLRDRASNNTLTNNSISDNANYGIYFTSDSTGNLVSGNLVCSNSVDIYDEDGNSGDENRCDTTHNWNDAGATGCTHTCTPTGSGVCYDYTTASWMTPNSTTDWNVTHRIVCNDTVITLNGDLA
ncbi:MAG: right-handed parallel beta-helix repeat-containing protein, partial [Euryarchaeota archaeon]|nr:right-handed parallel beta-helix repeat-containing protein [Euryarchaeota archaeon]